jgi:hypothetical protein
MGTVIGVIVISMLTAITQCERFGFDLIRQSGRIFADVPDFVVAQVEQ